MPRRCQGFTLLEMMIVIVVIGVLVGMVSLASGVNPTQQARQEAGALAGVIRQLREQAVLEGREYGLRLSVEGYRSMRLEGQAWEPLAAFHRWPDNLRLNVEQDGYSLSLGADAGPPQIQLYSSDEISSFRLTLAGKDRVWASLSSDGVGEVMIDD